MAMPENSRKFACGDFSLFLRECKAHIVPTTNPYEVLRYKTHDGHARGTHIVYKKANGKLTYTGDSRSHYWSFMQGEKLDLYITQDKKSKEPPKKEPKERKPKVYRVDGKPSRTKTEVARMLERDGDLCFACKNPLGDDVTREHLLPKSIRAGESLHNKVLMHSQCNMSLADLPLGHKIDMIIEMRGGDD